MDELQTFETTMEKDVVIYVSIASGTKAATAIAGSSDELFDPGNDVEKTVEAVKIITGKSLRQAVEFNVPIADIDQVWVGLKVARQGQCLSVGEDTITRLDGRAVRFDFVGMMSSEGFKTCDPAMMPVIAEIQNKN
jgi:hypothetical protein